MTLLGPNGHPLPAQAARAPAAAPVGLGAAILGGYSRPLPRRGTRELLISYTKSPILQAICRKIAYAVAAVPFYVEVDGKRVAGHMLEHLMMRGPKGGLSGIQATVTEELNLLLVGEAFAALDMSLAGLPYQRWPIPAHWVQEVPIGANNVFRVVSGYGAQVSDIPADRMIWYKEVDPFAPYERGAGVGRALSDELETDERAAQHIAATLANRALPEAIVSAASKDATLGAADRERLQSRLEERFGGPSNAGRTLVASAPLSVHQLTPSFGELKLTELRQDERNIMVHAFGFPPELIGKLSGSNKATITAAEYLFTKHVIVPRCEARRSTLNDQIAPLFEGAVVQYESPVEEDWEYIARIQQQAPHAFSIDEVRAAANHKPLDDGRGERFPQNFAVVYDDYPEQGTPVDHTSPTTLSAKHPRRLKDALSASLAVVQDDEFDDVLREAIRAAAAEFGARALDQAGLAIAFNLRDPRVSQAIASRAAEASRIITGTTRDQLRRTLADGLERSETTDQLADRIRRTLGPQTTAARARMIARTEIVWSSNMAAVEAFHQGDISQKQWLSTFDDRVRDTHRALDGQVTGVDGVFEVDGYTGGHPGGFGVAELDINCRCGVLPVIPEQERDATARARMWKALDAGRRPHERRLERRVETVFSRIERQVIAAVEGS